MNAHLFKHELVWRYSIVPFSY